MQQYLQQVANAIRTQNGSKVASLLSFTNWKKNVLSSCSQFLKQNLPQLNQSVTGVTKRSGLATWESFISLHSQVCLIHLGQNNHSDAYEMLTKANKYPFYFFFFFYVLVYKSLYISLILFYRVSWLF